MGVKEMSNVEFLIYVDEIGRMDGLEIPLLSLSFCSSFTDRIVLVVVVVATIWHLFIV